MPESFHNVEAHFVDEFSDLTQLRAQQLTRKTEECAFEESATGRTKYFDQVGLTEWREDNSRFPDSPEQDVEHYRRKLTPRRFHWGKHLDEFDDVQMLTDRKGKYVLSSTGAYSRLYDTVHILALGGNAIVEAPDGTTSTIPLPSSQQVAITVGGSSGDVNLNERKIRAAKAILGSNDVDMDDPMNELFGFCTPDALYGGLMGQDKFVSSDFVMDKPLPGDPAASGSFTYMGIKWKVSNRLPFDGSSTTDRKCYIWAKSGLARAVWKPLATRSALRADKCFVDYVYMRSLFNVTRMEEEKVVEVLVDETASATTAA